MTSVDPRAVIGAANNADLYEAVFAAHGIAFQRGPQCFLAMDPPPPFYGHAVVLAPGAGLRDDLRAISSRFGGRLAVKDSFDDQLLEDVGFRPLFSASWLYREAGGALPAWWRAVQGAEELAAWEAAWGETSPATTRVFPDPILTNSKVVVLACWQGGEIVAGCVANRSAGSIGLSNVFGAGASVFAEAANAVGSFALDLPVVGYESGVALHAAKAAGFNEVGPLRVMIADEARL